MLAYEKGMVWGQASDLKNKVTLRVKVSFEDICLAEVNSVLLH